MPKLTVAVASLLQESLRTRKRDELALLLSLTAAFCRVEGLPIDSPVNVVLVHSGPCHAMFTILRQTDRQGTGRV